MRFLLKIVTICFLLFLPITLLTHIGFIDKTYLTIIFNQFFNTVSVIVPVMAITLITGFLLSWSFIMYEFPLKSILEKILILGMIFPSYVLAIFYSEVFDVSGKVALIGTLSISSLPYVFMMLMIGLKSQPQQLIDSALMFGKQHNWVKLKVLFPLMVPSMVLSSFLVFGDTFSEFGATYFFGVDTVMTGIYEIWFGLHETMQGLKISAWVFLIILISYFFVNGWKSSIKKYNQNALQSKSFTPIKPKELGSKGWFLTLAILTITTFSFFIPIEVLFQWLLENNSKTNWLKVIGVTFNSVSLATLISVLVLVITTVSLYLFKKNMVVLTALSNSLYSTPGIILAISTIYLFSNSVIASSIAFLSVLILKYLAIGIDGVSIGLNKIPRQLYYDAKSFGKSSTWYIKNVQLPLSVKSYLLAFLLVWIDVIRELAIGLTIRPQGLDLLSIEIFKCMDLEMLSMSSPWILSMVLITIFPIYMVNNVMKLK